MLCSSRGLTEIEQLPGWHFPSFLTSLRLSEELGAQRPRRAGPNVRLLSLDLQFFEAIIIAWVAEVDWDQLQKD